MKISIAKEYTELRLTGSLAGHVHRDRPAEGIRRLEMGGTAVLGADRQGLADRQKSRSRMLLTLQQILSIATYIFVLSAKRK